MVSRDLYLSGGYLDGLESLLARIDPCTDLAQAFKILGLVTLGNRLKRPELLHRARYCIPNFRALSETPSQIQSCLGLLSHWERLC